MKRAYNPKEIHPHSRYAERLRNVDASKLSNRCFRGTHNECKGDSNLNHKDFPCQCECHD